MAAALLFAWAGTVAGQAPAIEGGVTGTVHSATGAPIAGVTVLLDETAKSTTTDAAGAFAFAAVAPGSYTVTASAAGWIPARQPVTVAAGARASVAITLTPGEPLAPLGRPEQLAPVVVTAPQMEGAVTTLPPVRGAAIFSGKKTEVVQFDSLTANTGQDVTRDLLGRVPGANISETQHSGFPSNGLGFRGLNPVQSVEMNTRQDGVNIVADLYGYPETYYTPPAEAVERVELLRGSSALQFGPQFGGVVDYLLRDGTPNTPLTFTMRQTGGSFGAFNSYVDLAGGGARWTCFGYAQYRGEQGWRPNSDLAQLSAAARLAYRPSSRLRFAVEYSLLRNQIHMPGGLTDAAFTADPQQSLRPRNWLASPWNVVAATAQADLSAATVLVTTVSYMFSQRYLVWRNEDGGPGAIDGIDSTTFTYSPREVEREYFNNVTNETRLRTSYRLFGASHTLATGFRVFSGTLHRQQGAAGTTGADFDMSIVTPYPTDVRFGNTNLAWFAENIFRLNDRLSVVPGLRIEYLHSTAEGAADNAPFGPSAKDRTFALGGLGAQYRATDRTDLYANVTQAYRPIEYSFITPFGSTARVDPNLRDPTGFNADLGWRGTLGRGITFDLGLFYLAYHDRVGYVSVDSGGTTYAVYRNVATSVHQGVEAYLELSPLRWIAPATAVALRVWDAFGYTHARYGAGAFSGNTVEFAPDVVNRLGVSCGLGPATVALEWSLITKQFTDANNTVASANATVGLIPSYQVLDLTFAYRLGRATLSAGVNNLADSRYFTMRTPEYPGPGIIPALGRSAYATMRVGL